MPKLETNTYDDSGKAFSDHDIIAKRFDVDGYVATLYHAWEQGNADNANSWQRPHLTKTKGQLNVTPQQVTAAVHKLDSRLRIGFTLAFRAMISSPS